MTETQQFVSSDNERLCQLLGFPYKEPPIIPDLVRKYADGCDSWEDFVHRVKRGQTREKDSIKKAALKWLEWQARKLIRSP